MIHLPASVRVYLCLSPCDMRRSFDGLHALVRDHLQLDAFAGHLYLFANKRRDRLQDFVLGSRRIRDLGQAPGGRQSTRSPLESGRDAAGDHGRGAGSAAERHRSEHGQRGASGIGERGA